MRPATAAPAGACRHNSRRLDAPGSAGHLPVASSPRAGWLRGARAELRPARPRTRPAQRGRQPSRARAARFQAGEPAARPWPPAARSCRPPQRPRRRGRAKSPRCCSRPWAATARAPTFAVRVGLRRGKPREARSPQPRLWRAGLRRRRSWLRPEPRFCPPAACCWPTLALRSRLVGIDARAGVLPQATCGRGTGTTSGRSAFSRWWTTISSTTSARTPPTCCARWTSTRLTRRGCFPARRDPTAARVSSPAR